MFSKKERESRKPIELRSDREVKTVSARFENLNLFVQMKFSVPVMVHHLTTAVQGRLPFRAKWQASLHSGREVMVKHESERQHFSGTVGFNPWWGLSAKIAHLSWQNGRVLTARQG